MKRYYIEGTVILLEPLHIGRGDEEEFVDNPILRDEKGMPIIPGTSMAGIMSSLLERILKLKGYGRNGLKKEQSLLFGRGDEDAFESCLIVHDLPLLSDCEPMVEDHNAVDRQRGSAHEGHLFHTEVIPSGTAFEFICEFRERFRDSDENKKALGLLIDILQLMERGWAWIGGRSGTGHGRFRLDGICCKVLEMANPEHILLFTKNSLEDTIKALPQVTLSEPKDNSQAVTPVNTSAPEDSSFSPEVIMIEGVLRPIEPLLVKTGLSLETVDLKGALIRDNERDNEIKNLKNCPVKDETITVDSAFCREGTIPYLPGSSIRGVLRNHAERMLRTLVFKRCVTSSIHEDVAEEIACESAWMLDNLRQRGKERRDKAFPEIYDSACLISRVFGFTAMGGRVRVSNAYPINPQAFEEGLKLMDHVAIDRFTGGSADKKKFNARPFFPSNPPDDKGDMHFYICLEDFERWHFGLVALLLKDLMNGRISIGYGKNKGFGRVRLLPESLRIRVLTSDSDGLKPYLKTNNQIAQIIAGEIKVNRGKNFWIDRSCIFYDYVIQSIKDFGDKINQWIENRKVSYEQGQTQ